jgi:hypothetical protein
MGHDDQPGNVTPPQALGSGFTTTNFSQVITGLTASVEYFFRAVASNNLGVASGSTLTFTTRPTVETLPATNVGLTGATLNGVANPKGADTRAWFEWGLTTNYGSVTPPQALGSGGNDVNFSEVLTNLFSDGTFHFRAVASNEVGVLTGANQSFQTPAPAFADLTIRGTVTVTNRPKRWPMARAGPWMAALRNRPVFRKRPSRPDTTLCSSAIWQTGANRQQLMFSSSAGKCRRWRRCSHPFRRLTSMMFRNNTPGRARRSSFS